MQPRESAQVVAGLPAGPAVGTPDCSPTSGLFAAEVLPEDPLLLLPLPQELPLAWMPTFKFPAERCSAPAVAQTTAGDTCGADAKTRSCVSPSPCTTGAKAVGLPVGLGSSCCVDVADDDPELQEKEPEPELELGLELDESADPVRRAEEDEPDPEPLELDLELEDELEDAEEDELEDEASGDRSTVGKASVACGTVTGPADARAELPRELPEPKYASSLASSAFERRGVSTAGAGASWCTRSSASSLPSWKCAASWICSSVAAFWSCRSYPHPCRREEPALPSSTPSAAARSSAVAPGRPSSSSSRHHLTNRLQLHSRKSLEIFSAAVARLSSPVSPLRWIC